MATDGDIAPRAANGKRRHEQKNKSAPHFEARLAQARAA